MATFPLAGLVLGALLVGLDRLLSLTTFPLATRNILLVVALVALTGGLHLDGLMDTCDGLIGGHNAQQRLNIMRDSHVGSYGVLGGVCVVLLKVGTDLLREMTLLERVTWFFPETAVIVVSDAANPALAGLIWVVRAAT